MSNPLIEVIWKIQSRTIKPTPYGLNALKMSTFNRFCHWFTTPNRKITIRNSQTREINQWWLREKLLIAGKAQWKLSWQNGIKCVGRGSWGVKKRAHEFECWTMHC